MNPAELPADEIAYFPAEGWIEPARLIGHLLATAEAERIWYDAVTGIDVSGGLVRSVRLASGRRLPADAVVNCAGPAAAGIAALAGLSLPMRNTRGVLIYTSPVAVAVSRVVHAPHVHLRPDGAGRLLLHTHDIDGAAHVSEDGEIEWIRPPSTRWWRPAARSTRDMRAASVESVRVGERPIPGDGLPVLGRAPGLPNFHFAVSHSGATLSVHAGALVAGEVLGEDHSGELAPFRFERL